MADINKDGFSKQGFSPAVQNIKAELRGKVAKANKRVSRLEENDLTELSAYKGYSNKANYKGGEKFTSAGSDYRELQKELARVDKFLNNKTSLVRQANKQLKEIANNTGIKYDNVADLPALTANFFELASKAEQYLRNVQGTEAVQYQEIWEEINQYLEKQGIDLNDAGTDLEAILAGLTENINPDNQEPDEFDDMDWFTVD